MIKTVLILACLTIVGAVCLTMMQTQNEKKLPTPKKEFNPMQEGKSNPLPELKNPRIVVKKHNRRLELFDGEKLVKTYKIGLGFAPEGDKEKQGDGKTPEGDFYVFVKNPKSNFYLSLGLSYPATDDAKRGLKSKLINQNQHDQIAKAIKNKQTPLQNTKLGGEIYIHGGGSSSDWTFGCIALENEDIKEIFEAVSAGINVKIEP
ncbi:MAG: L,D-transpeptidase family protein [Acidobacteriota bacterium]|nr:L,D-transpeptidase family protein [Acidobacteriota bacterium]